MLRSWGPRRHRDGDLIKPAAAITMAVAADGVTDNVAIAISFEGDLTVTWTQTPGDDGGNITFQAAKLEKLAEVPP